MNCKSKICNYDPQQPYPKNYFPKDIVVALFTIVFSSRKSNQRFKNTSAQTHCPSFNLDGYSIVPPHFAWIFMRNIGPTLQINHSACRKVFHSMDFTVNCCYPPLVERLSLIIFRFKAIQFLARVRHVRSFDVIF